MGSEIDSDKLSRSLLEIQNRLEDLRTRCISDPGNAKEILSDALEQLQITFEELSAADEELTQQNEELIVANENLQASEARYKSLAENIPSVLMRYDRDLRVVYLGPQAEKFTGIPSDQFIGKTNREVGMPEDLCDLWETAIDRVFQTGINQDLEFDLPAANGPRTFYLKLSPEFAPDGVTVQNVLGISTDITELKRAEEALRQSEERFRKVFEHTAFGMIIGDMEGRVLESNPAMERMLGYSKDELRYKPFSEFTHPDDLTTERPQIEKLIAGQTDHYEIEKRYIRKDGQIIWVRLIGSLTRDNNGRPLTGIALIEDITKRKLVEEELSQSRARLAWVLDKTGIGMWLNELPLGHLNWDEQTKRLFFIPLDAEPTIELFWSRIHPDDREPTRLAVEKAIRDRTLYGIDHRAVNPDTGTVRWIHSAGQATYTPDGTPVLFDGINYDITERKRAEEEIKRQNAVVNGINEIFESALKCKTEEDLGQTCLAVAEKITGSKFGFLGEIGPDGRLHDIAISDPGWSLCEMYDQTGHRRPPGDFQLHGLYGRVLQDGQSLLTNSPADHPDSIGTPPGHPPLTAFLGVPLIHQGRTIGIVALANRDGGYRRDEMESAQVLAPVIVEAYNQIRADEALRESEEKYKELVENANSIIIKMDNNGKISFFNDYAQKFFGYSLDEILGQNVIILLPPTESGSSRNLEEMADAILSSPDDFVENINENVRKNGERVWISWRNKAIRNARGDIVGNLAVGQDITERKRMEEDLRRSREELELRVKERTAELSEAKESLEVINEELRVELEQHQKLEAELIIAKDQSMEAVQAKAAFMANMSHELRTPMNSILGFTSLLLEEPLSAEYKDWLETMRMNGEALLALINDVLDFSKMEKDKIELEIHPFNLRQRIEESLDLVSTKAAEKGLDLAYIMDSNVPETIISDSARLLQVLANLLSNAVKFTDTGDVLVHVTSKPEGDFHEIHFAVQDTGIGVPQSQMSKLFQPFSQINTTPSRLTEGTGLGLSISKKLVELMGGKIWAESEEGKGSTFIFTIKARAAPDDEDTKLPVGPQPQLAKRSVLIVEDNQTMRRLLGHQTKSWGMVPLVVSLSYSANELIQNGVTPDVAIIDASMPDLNGVVLAQMIRRHRKDLPLIIMTSPGQHIPQNLLAVNLPKPIKPMQLYDALTNLLEGRPIQVQCQTPAANQTSVSQLRILLAEDNISSQQVAMGMLKKLGYKADVAANGVEVIQAIERQPYDIVLMDVKMPVMDGLEATRIIRQRWPNNGPKIVAITAYAMEGDREKCFAAGMDGYISKPVKKDDLANVLKRYRQSKNI